MRLNHFHKNVKHANKKELIKLICRDKVLLSSFLRLSNNNNNQINDVVTMPINTNN